MDEFVSQLSALLGDEMNQWFPGGDGEIKTLYENSIIKDKDMSPGINIKILVTDLLQTHFQNLKTSSTKNTFVDEMGKIEFQRLLLKLLMAPESCRGDVWSEMPYALGVARDIFHGTDDIKQAVVDFRGVGVTLIKIKTIDQRMEEMERRVSLIEHRMETLTKDINDRLFIIESYIKNITES